MKSVSVSRCSSFVLCWPKVCRFDSISLLPLRRTKEIFMFVSCPATRRPFCSSLCVRRYFSTNNCVQFGVSLLSLRSAAEQKTNMNFPRRDKNESEAKKASATTTSRKEQNESISKSQFLFFFSSEILFLLIFLCCVAVVAIFLSSPARTRARQRAE